MQALVQPPNMVNSAEIRAGLIEMRSKTVAKGHKQLFEDRSGANLAAL